MNLKPRNEVVVFGLFLSEGAFVNRWRRVKHEVLVKRHVL